MQGKARPETIRRGTMPHEIFEGVAAVVHVDGATIRLKANCRVDDIETNNGRRRIDGCPPSSETLNIAYPLSRFLRLLNLANSVLRFLPSA